MATHRLIAAAVLLLTAAGCASERVNTMSFASMAEARAAGMVERAWVPAVLPEGAYELRVAYEPDGTKRWGLFNFREADAASVRAIVAADEISLEGTVIDIPRRIEWWPIAMRGALDHESLAATGLKAYRGREPGLVIAVNWSQGRAYYWSTR